MHGLEKSLRKKMAIWWIGREISWLFSYLRTALVKGTVELNEHTIKSLQLGSLSLAAKIARFARPIWAPPGGKVAMTDPHYLTKYQPNRPTNSWKTQFTLWWRPLVADSGATWWQGSYDLPWPSTQVSAKSANRQLKKSTFYTLAHPWWQIWAPPGCKVAMTYPHHPPKYQPNRPANNWVIDRSRWHTRTHAPI